MALFGVILVHISPHFDWITPNKDIFQAVFANVSIKLDEEAMKLSFYFSDGYFSKQKHSSRGVL